MHLIYLLAGCCFLLAVGGPSLTAQSSLQDLRITSVTVDDGLSQNEVTALLRDRAGYLWIGTRGGLNRYTGQDFDVYHNEPGRSRSLTNSSVECLAEDGAGSIWVGTKAGGISVFDPLTETFSPPPLVGQDDFGALPDARVIALQPAGPRYVWAGTWEGGTARYDREQQRFATLHPRLRTNQFHYDASARTLWAATSEGLVRFSEDGTQYSVMNDDGFRELSFLSLTYHAASRSFFLGSWGGGLFRYFPAEDRWQRYDMTAAAPGRSGATNCYRVTVDDRGYCWVSTWGGGLYRLHIGSGHLEYVPLHPDPLLADSPFYQVTLGVLPAADGSLWVGTNGAGLLHLTLNAGRFNVRQAAPLRQLPVWSVLEDRTGGLLVGAKGYGTTYYQEAVDRPFHRLAVLSPASLDSSSLRPGVTLGVRALHAGRGCYYGATNFGLFRFARNGHQWRARPLRLRTEGDALRHPVPHASVIYQDSRGYYWIGTQQSGLWRATEPGPPEAVPFRSYRSGSGPGQLGSNRITDVVEDAAGRVWVTTYGGLHRYRPLTDDFVAYRSGAHALSSDIVLSITIDEDNRLWLGTPNGINIATLEGDAPAFSHLTTADGLSNNYVQSLEADRQGAVWAATIRGLTKIATNSFAMTRYYVEDGLPGNSFMENVSYRSPTGRLYFGGTDGLVSFYPDSIALCAALPEVVIRDLKVNSRSVNQSGEGVLPRALVDTAAIELSYDADVVTLDYAALDFGPGKQISYAYRLAGLEPEWNEAADRRSVTYADLSPGDYTFEVMAARSGRNWGPVTRLGITVFPPPWATPWAYLLYGLLFLSLLYGYRLILRRRNELRNRAELAELSRSKDAEIAESKTHFFTNVTHELRTPLTLITGPVTELLGDELPPRQREMLETVERNAQRLLLLCNQLLDFRKVESGQLQLRAARGNFVPFVHEVTLSFREAARQKGIRLVFDCEHQELPLTYDRNQLEIVLCNLLSNSLKYAPAGTDVTVTLAAPDREWVTLSVSDRGRGISPELAEKIFDRYYQIANTESSQLVGTGIGLALARGIVQAHHGTIRVDATPGRGSTFTVELRTGMSHFSADELLTDFRPSDAPEHYARQVMEVVGQLGKQAAADAPEILVVEDNPEIRGFLTGLLRPHYRVREAENGQQALTTANERPPDLVLSDVMMPVLDGISLCGALREQEATGHLPVILLTARTSTVHQIEGYGQGADAYVTKPFDAGVLLARIEALLRQRRELKRYYASRVTLSPAEVPIADAEREWLEATIAYVEHHIDRSDLSRAEVAAAMAMSESTFYRRLKTMTGETWGGFVRSLRLMRAAQLLQAGKCSVSDAAYQAGFTDLKHFRNCFREQFGKSPAEYRDVAPAAPPY